MIDTICQRTPQRSHLAYCSGRSVRTILARPMPQPGQYPEKNILSASGCEFIFCIPGFVLSAARLIFSDSLPPFGINFKFTKVILVPSARSTSFIKHLIVGRLCHCHSSCAFAILHPLALPSKNLDPTLHSAWAGPDSAFSEL